MSDYPGKNFFGAPERRVQNTIMMAKAGGEPMQSANAKNQCIFDRSPVSAISDGRIVSFYRFFYI